MIALINFPRVCGGRPGVVPLVVGYFPLRTLPILTVRRRRAWLPVLLPVLDELIARGRRLVVSRTLQIRLFLVNQWWWGRAARFSPRCFGRKTSVIRRCRLFTLFLRIKLNLNGFQLSFMCHRLTSWRRSRLMGQGSESHD